MVRPKETHRQLLNRIAGLFPNVFRTDGRILFCKICEENVNVDQLSLAKQHMRTISHQTASDRKAEREKPGPSQRLITEYENPDGGRKLNEFSMDLTDMFVRANIPLHKVTNQAVKSFFEKYTNHSIPSDTTLRTNYVPVLYEKEIKRLREKAAGKFIWVTVDETTDCENRMVANFVFGILDENADGKSYLFNVELMEATNKNTMAVFFNNSMNLLYPNGKTKFACCVFSNFDVFFVVYIGIQYDKLLLVVTDAAGYMLAAMDGLKLLYPKMIHVTCLAHGLHRVAEFVRNKYVDVNHLIAYVKSIFVKVFLLTLYYFTC